MLTALEEANEHHGADMRLPDGLAPPMDWMTSCASKEIKALPLLVVVVGCMVALVLAPIVAHHGWWVVVVTTLVLACAHKLSARRAMDIVHAKQGE
jgi:hypothetical protein